jgi:hypothetical protein
MIAEYPEPSSQDLAPVPDDGDDHDKFCRICHETTDDGADGRLFRPCSCRGSMAWVHVECLDKWRRASANPQSFYRCDQCHYEYQFGRAFEAYGHGFGDKITVARLLSSRLSIHAASVVVLLLVVFVAGFFGKLLGLSPLTPDRLTWAQVFQCFNLNHLYSGSMLVGLGSLSGFLIESCSTVYRFGRIGGAWGNGWGGGLSGGGGRGGGDAQKIILVILVVVGLLVALRWIYVRLQILAESAARQAQDVILDAHHLHEPKESAAALQDAEAQPLLHRDDSDGDYGTPPRER